LFLGTQRDNLRDMLKKQRNHRPSKGSWQGNRNPRAKITEDDVRAMRREYVEGLSLRVLARKYGIAHTAIASVLKRRSWAWVP
jgi:DNA invertase Pin-like site-specific DNA recombinase